MKNQASRLARAGIAALCSVAVCGALLTAPQAQAINLMDLHAEQLMFSANDIKTQLNLTPNQLLLWQQVAAKAGALLRTRQIRRERLHGGAKTRLADPRFELRDLAAVVEEESATSAAEDKQLRALWLDMNDALDDRQRASVSQFLLSQLERVDAPERGARPGGREGGREGGPPGGGRKSGGMGGGMPRN